MTSEEGMQSLIKKIDEYFYQFPQARDVSILEGELSNMESLLYVLKGEGVIDLFEKKYF